MMIVKILKDGKFLAAAVLAALVAAAAFQGCEVVTYKVKLTSITVTPASSTIAAITNQQFTAMGKYSDDSEKDITAEVTWSSSDSSVATVDSKGLATPTTPTKAGTTTITASLEGVSGSATLTVTNAQLQSIDVTPANPSIANGTSIQFTATGHFDDSSTQTITSLVTWESSTITVTISNTAGSKGLATSTALGPATSTISAVFSSITGTTTMTVKDVTLTSISVTPASATINVGQTQQFTATGTFSDSSTQNMTSEVTWDSSATSVATISSTGRATGVFAGGPITITATSNALLGSVQGTAQLTVQSSGGGY